MYKVMSKLLKLLQLQKVNVTQYEKPNYKCNNQSRLDGSASCWGVFKGGLGGLAPPT